MHIDELTPEEYRQLFQKAPHIFNSVEFTELNRDKCDEVRYLAFSDIKLRAGIIIGKRDGVWMSPFSAPFGGLTANKNLPIETVDSVFRQMILYIGRCNGGLKITLPPVWYSPDLLVKCINALSRIEGIKSIADISYHLNLSDVEGIDESRMTVTGRQNLRRALKATFEFSKADSTAESIAEVYEVIRRNHTERGYPLRMSLDDVIATAETVPADFFLLRLDGVPVAGAQVYNVAHRTAQLINWGDIREASSLCPMNRMAYELAGYYSQKGVQKLDLGPATECGIPNIGLCRFKESLGADSSLKFTFSILHNH